MKNIISGTFAFALDIVSLALLLAFVITAVRRFIAKEKPTTRFGYDFANTVKQVFGFVVAKIKRLFSATVAYASEKIAESNTAADTTTTATTSATVEADTEPESDVEAALAEICFEQSLYDDFDVE